MNCQLVAIEINEKLFSQTLVCSSYLKHQKLDFDSVNIEYLSMECRMLLAGMQVVLHYHTLIFKRHANLVSLKSLV